MYVFVFLFTEKVEKFHISIIHERLGEVLRILKGVLEKYPALQSNVLSVTAGNLIQIVKGLSEL